MLPVIDPLGQLGTQLLLDLPDMCEVMNPGDAQCGYAATHRNIVTCAAGHERKLLTCRLHMVYLWSGNLTCVSCLKVSVDNLVEPISMVAL